jgi:hypothetical protein
MRKDVCVALRNLLTEDLSLISYGVGEKVAQFKSGIDPKTIGLIPPYLVFNVQIGASSEGLPVEAINIMIWGVVSNKITIPMDTLDDIMYRVITLLDGCPENLEGQHCYLLIKQDTDSPEYIEGTDFYAASISLFGNIRADHLITRR